MKKMTAILVTLCMLAALLAGCGGASKSTQAFDAAAPAAAAPAEAANGAYYDMESAKSEDGGLTGDTDSTVLPEGRKWIITVNMSAETEDLDALMEALNGKISGLGGYVEDQDSYNGSMYSSRRYRSASLTVRIPAQRVDEFTEEMSGIANVVSTNLSREKNHPSGLHVGFQLLTLHCPSSLVDMEPFYVPQKREYQRKRRNVPGKCTTFSSLFYRSFPVHKIFTEYCIFPLAFFAKLRYYISTQSE